MKRALVALLLAACADDAVTVPVRPAPPSRHAALATALTDDVTGFAFADGDWLEDLGDAPYYGLAWLARGGRAPGLASARAQAGRLLTGPAPLAERAMAAAGAIEDMAATGDRSLAALVDAFLAEVGDAPDLGQGTTAGSAFVARLVARRAVVLGGDAGRATAIDGAIGARAFSDLVDPFSGASARGYATEPGGTELADAPNVAMVLLKAELFRLTKNEDYRLEARALAVALRQLLLSDGRYATRPSPTTRGYASLAGQSGVALAMLALFEITGEQRFIDEVDRLLDVAAGMRGPYCAVPTGRCATGLLHHATDGRLVAAPDAPLFSSGCTLQVLWVLGQRRLLAGEPFVP